MTDANVCMCCGTEHPTSEVFRMGYSPCCGDTFGTRTEYDAQPEPTF